MRTTIRNGTLLTFCALFAFAARAQTTLPTVTSPLSAVSATVGVAGPTVDLRGHFGIAGVTKQVVQFDTSLGKVNVELLSADAPLTVQNFLSYVNKEAYKNCLIHRSVPGFVLQGGGYTATIPPVPIAQSPAVVNEYKLSNLRGTMAMAKLGSSPDSATNQWFFNLADNSANLDAQNGGFTVFARVIGTGMSVVDAIAALPRLNAGSPYDSLPVRNYNGSTALVVANLVAVNSISPIPVLPDGSAGVSVLTLTASSSNPAVATAAISGSTLTVTPVGGGTCTITVRATDTNGNMVEAGLAATVLTGPSIATHPASQNITENGSATLTVAPVGSAVGFSYRWFHNGAEIAGATGTQLQLTDVHCAQAGIYVAEVTSGTHTTRSRPAVVGVAPAAGVQTTGAIVTRPEWQSIHHSNGNVYDQFLLTGASGTITAAAGKIARVSLLDEQNNIVQFEMSGPGALTIVLANPSGPKAPELYNQPGIQYMQGTPTVVLSGADASTYMSIYSVGRKTNPGVTRLDVTYNGWANVCAAGIQSTTGGLGGLFYGNVIFASADGPAGIVAPSVRTVGTLNFHELTTTAAGQPMILLDPEGQANIKITGGNLGQPSGSPIEVSGLYSVQMVAGQGSSGQDAAVQQNQGRLLFEGIDITTELIVGP